MANYNSGKLYNRLMTNGGANYNSGPFMIVVLDSGSGIDNINSLVASLSINDNGIAQENILLIANIDILDASISSSDMVSITNNVDVFDSAIGTDKVLPISANVSVSDLGIGQEQVGVAGAFFVVDAKGILQPLGVLISRDSRYELLPATRDNTEEIPGRHGELDFGTEFKPRYIELQVNTRNGLIPLEKSQLQRLFAKYLDPTKGAKTLIFSDDIEKTYRVKYSGQIDIKQFASWFQFVIPFKMHDPIITGSFEKVLIGSRNIDNDGTFETPIIIEIAGSSTNPTVTIGADSFSYTGTIPSGQMLIIDTDKATAKLNGANVLDKITGPLPYYIQPGSVSVTAGDNVTIRWHDRWI